MGTLGRGKAGSALERRNVIGKDFKQALRGGHSDEERMKVHIRGAALYQEERKKWYFKGRDGGGERRLGSHSYLLKKKLSDGSGILWHIKGTLGRPSAAAIINRGAPRKRTTRTSR